MNRIKSYTIIEMLVVMLISSLSITISYTCYTIFSNHYLQYKKNSDELAHYILLDKLLTKDISSSVKVIKTHLGVECIKKKERIQYEFQTSSILRRGSIIDTFYVNESGPVNYKRFGQMENIPGGLLDEISMELLYKGEKLYFYYKKAYGSDVLMLNDEELILNSEF